MELRDDGYCFACGKHNPIGLKLEFSFDGLTAMAKFTPKREHQGWSNVIHGGVLSTLLDELMAWAIIHNDIFAVTSKMEVRFLRPAHIDEELTVIGLMEKNEEKTVQTSGKILNSSGKCIASARGTYVKMPVPSNAT